MTTSFNTTAETRIIDCPLCAGYTCRLVESLPTGYDLWTCSKCDLQFSSPMRAGSAEFYESFFPYQNLAKRVRTLSHIAKTWEFSFFLSLNLWPGGRLLDVGCGKGDFLALARSSHYCVYGVDVNPRAVEIARSGYGLANVVCDDLAQHGRYSQGQKFHCVTMFNVLEHLDDPLAMVKTATRLLLPEGYLVIQVPTAKRWPPLFHPGIDSPPHHLTLWSEESLRRLFIAASLSPVLIHRKPLLASDVLVNARARYAKLRWPDWRGVAFLNIGRAILHLPLGLMNRGNRVQGYDVLGVAQNR